MEPTNEERTELAQLRNRKFWCAAGIIVGVLLLIITAGGDAKPGMAVVGAVLVLLGIAIRAKTTNRQRLIEARQEHHANRM